MVYSLWGGQVNHEATKLNDILMLTSENGVLWDVAEGVKVLGGLDIEASPTDGNPTYISKLTVAKSLGRDRDLRLGGETDGDGTAVTVKVGFSF